MSSIGIIWSIHISLLHLYLCKFFFAASEHFSRS